MLRDEREFLKDRNDDRNGVAERVGELLRIVFDFHDDAGLVLELIDSLLELLIENEAVRYDNDGVEDFAVLRVMKTGEAMSKPRDAVALAAASGVPDEVVLAGAGGARVGD